MAGIGQEEGMVEKALDSVKERLDTPYGIVLNNPAFTRYVIEYGEISTYPPGYKENAGIFCHNNPWIMIRSEEHTSELQSRPHLVCRLLLEKKKKEKTSYKKP